ncbi:hypothetical protein BGZ93_008543 [Podila epicladia]|nr:hypothetical protein BGZ92_003140 [Podila epicladia]KAG0091994.1 hypothetical protein BGZ93_008543 [Podila epicladia]
MALRVHVLQTMNRSMGCPRMHAHAFSTTTLNLTRTRPPLKPALRTRPSTAQKPKKQHSEKLEQEVFLGEHSSSSPFPTGQRKAYKAAKKARRTIIEQVEPSTTSGADPARVAARVSRINPVTERLRFIRQRYEQRKRFDHWDSRHWDPRRHNHYQRSLHHAMHRLKHTHSRGPDPRDPSMFGRFPPWWNLQMAYIMEYRRAIFRSFLGGSLITGLGITIYNGKYNQWVQFKSFARDFAAIRESLAQTETFNQIRIFGTRATSSSSQMSPVGSALDGPVKQLKMMTPQQVELRLAENQRSFDMKAAQEKDCGNQRRGRRRSEYTLIHGYSTNQVASNNPIEDDMSQHVVRDVDGRIEGVFFGVFDGHSGWCCSQKVAQELAPSVANELDQIRGTRDINEVTEAIEAAFVKLDRRIVHDTVQRVLDQPSRHLACSSLLPAISGSCALLAYINILEHDLYVACAGDSRAVLGVREPTSDGGHVWRAVPLSFDQTGRNPWEVKRLQQEHPGEETTVVKRGRVLGGLEPTRAFGDSRYKWTKEIQDQVFALFPAYRQPRNGYNSPPYVTAKPVVRHHKIQPNDRFMVMATDGLWDELTSDEVVQLVGDLLDGKTGQEEIALDREDILAYGKKLQSIREQQAIASGHEVEEQQQQQEEEPTPKDLAAKGSARKFTFRDHAHAATHLIRNALGGANDDKVAATLSIPSPMSRRYRDDISVTVVFFGPQDNKITLSDASDTHGVVDIP